MNDRVVSLASHAKPDELLAAVAQLRDRLPGMLEYQRIMAKVKREAFVAYLEAGFTDAQALDLVKEIR